MTVSSADLSYGVEKLVHPHHCVLVQFRVSALRKLKIGSAFRITIVVSTILRSKSVTRDAGFNIPFIK